MPGVHASLTGAQLSALKLLARRLEAEDLEWINLADARALESIKFAAHSGRGWVITDAGRQALRSIPTRLAE
jgi:hypothetical protein